MYVSVCTVAGGSSGDEILFPCQINAFTAISIAADLGRCSHNACQKGTCKEKKDRRGGKHAERKAAILTAVQGFSTRLGD